MVASRSKNIPFLRLIIFQWHSSVQRLIRICSEGIETSFKKFLLRRIFEISGWNVHFRSSFQKKIHLSISLSLSLQKSRIATTTINATLDGNKDRTNRPVYRINYSWAKVTLRFPGKIQSFSLKRLVGYPEIPIRNHGMEDNQGDHHHVHQPISLLHSPFLHFNEDLRGVKPRRN